MLPLPDCLLGPHHSPARPDNRGCSPSCPFELLVLTNSSAAPLLRPVCRQGNRGRRGWSSQQVMSRGPSQLPKTQEALGLLLMLCWAQIWKGRDPRAAPGGHLLAPHASLDREMPTAHPSGKDHSHQRRREENLWLKVSWERWRRERTSRTQGYFQRSPEKTCVCFLASPVHSPRQGPPCQPSPPFPQGRCGTEAQSP